MSLEVDFDATFTARLALREKQIQQNYRPLIGIHKWFARRPGTVFRNLLLAEFNSPEPIATAYWRAHDFKGVIADPFMGGGTPIYEANRLGFSVVGADVNPMAFWIVRQSLASLDLNAFASEAAAVISDVEREIGELYHTTCSCCGQAADVKYFLWVKTQACPSCGRDNDLFPGYLLAEATRHPKHVLACAECGTLNEFDQQPTKDQPESCSSCGSLVHVEGPAHRHRLTCRHCGDTHAYPVQVPTGPPKHRLWALEYHCAACKPRKLGRFFKRPDSEDLARYETASVRLLDLGDDETDRLHRWGYRYYRQMFNDRQLLGLGLLLRRIRAVSEPETRHALLTVFSDVLRYQNMLCRYDTYALKCQDIFSVHGFPVGLVQCENNLLGIPSVGSGAYRHFIQKYLRAKRYCVTPFETRQLGRRKEIVPVPGERIAATFVDTFPMTGTREAQLVAASATALPVGRATLDGVFTDPPYYDNVQYAELMDFCFAWLRLGLAEEFTCFERPTTRTLDELTGNETMGRDIAHFTGGLSDVFCHYADALKPGAPFVFTYHHNDPAAYVPLVVAILDAGLDCTATLPAPAEMGASLHIAKTTSSVLDTVFVCRATPDARIDLDVEAQLRRDVLDLTMAEVRVTEGDVRCLLAGHLARLTINRLHNKWDGAATLSSRISCAHDLLVRLSSTFDARALFLSIKVGLPTIDPSGVQLEAAI
ncbi:MAG: DUF1156 domain-containing protein [Gemmatimonadaceae bacterium]